MRGALVYHKSLALSMNGENQPLVTNEPVEFEEIPVEAQDFRKTTHHFRGACEIYLTIMKTKSQHATSWPWKLH